MNFHSECIALLSCCCFIHKIILKYQTLIYPISQGLLVLFPYRKASTFTCLFQTVFLICIFAGLLVDETWGHVFVWCSACFCSAPSCGFTWKKSFAWGCDPLIFSWGRVMPAGNNDPPDCFLPHGICAGEHTLEMFI